MEIVASACVFVIVCRIVVRSVFAYFTMKRLKSLAAEYRDHLRHQENDRNAMDH